jgi:hypothetical protein
MPQNETAIPYTVVRKLIAETSNKTRLKQLDDAIDKDRIGIIFAYRNADTAFQIKRYRNGKFIKKVW